MIFFQQLFIKGNQCFNGGKFTSGSGRQKPTKTDPSVIALVVVTLMLVVPENETAQKFKTVNGHEMLEDFKQLLCTPKPIKLRTFLTSEKVSIILNEKEYRAMAHVVSILEVKPHVSNLNKLSTVFYEYNINRNGDKF